MFQILFLPAIFCVIGLFLGHQFGTHFGFDRAVATYAMGSIGSMVGIMFGARYCP